MKNYLLGRAESLTAWIGFIGFILEIVLHLGNASTLMLVLFVVLIVMPETKFRDLFADWTKKVRDLG
jgi:hypothetical protein